MQHAAYWWLVIVAIVLIPFKTGLTELDQGPIRISILENGRFTFAVIGDSKSNDEIYGLLLRQISKMNPDFVIHVGDMKGSSESWGRFLKINSSLTMPFFPVPGNHDVHNKHSESAFLRAFALSTPYYSFSAGADLFVVMDSEIPGSAGKIEGRQLIWLSHLLSSSNASHKFIFIHRPFFIPYKERNKSRGLGRYPESRDNIYALLLRYGITAIFTGHEHYYNRTIRDGITQIISGGGGGPLYMGKNKGGFHHFVMVTVDGEDIKGDVITVDGKVAESFSIKEKEAALMDMPVK